eukprot:13713865-Alexandrium_andersonii.AAC.1
MFLVGVVSCGLGPVWPGTVCVRACLLPCMCLPAGLADLWTKGRVRAVRAGRVWWHRALLACLPVR